MAKVFYDQILDLSRIEREIAKIASTKEEKEELTKIVDEYVHHRMVGCILTKLPTEHHVSFLTRFSEAPHHDGHWTYLRDKVSHDIEEFLKEEASLIGNELLNVISGKTAKKKKASKV